MLHSCGQTHFQLKHHSKGFVVEPDTIQHNISPVLLDSVEQIELYTSYLGKVMVNVTINDDTVCLEKYHKVHNKQLLVKIVDATEHNIDGNRQYSLNKLKSLSSKKINIEDNKYYYFLTLLCTKKLAQINSNSDNIQNIQNKIDQFLSNSSFIFKANKDYPELLSSEPTKSLSEYKKIYQNVIKYNSPVDIFFNTCNYLTFLYEKTGLVSVNNLDTILSVSGIPKLDNAFFTGQYMMYGSGDKAFYPLVSIDVIGHELSHGLVSGTANLEYKGHSGALNESYADIMGTMFEFYMYDKYPNLNGEKDWFIGEDLAINKPFLRSMENPNDGRQPDTYQGTYYLDPNSQMDFGGVHINSGIPNYCFYLASQNKDKEHVLSTFIQCLKSLTKTSDFIDFRDTLKRVSNNDETLITALDKVGLNNNAVSDYNQKNIPRYPKRNNRPRIPIPPKPPKQMPRYPKPVPPPTHRIPKQIPRYPTPPVPPPTYPFPRRRPRFPNRRPRFPNRRRLSYDYSEKESRIDNFIHTLNTLNDLINHFGL